MIKISKKEKAYRAFYDLADNDVIDEDDLVTWSPETERMHDDDYLPYGEY
jgi:hypothetical protein